MTWLDRDIQAVEAEQIQDKFDTQAPFLTSAESDIHAGIIDHHTPTTPTAGAQDASLMTGGGGAGAGEGGIMPAVLGQDGTSAGSGGGATRQVTIWGEGPPTRAAHATARVGRYLFFIGGTCHRTFDQDIWVLETDPFPSFRSPFAGTQLESGLLPGSSMTAGATTWPLFVQQSFRTTSMADATLVCSTRAQSLHMHTTCVASYT